jgi:uncharacterized protein
VKMVLDEAAGQNLIDAFDGESLVVRGRRFDHQNGLILFNTGIPSEWPSEDKSVTAKEALAAVIQQAPEVVILATGDRCNFPEPRTLIRLMDKRIGYEVMDTPSACRTFNILLGEDRAAALVIQPKP